MSNCPRCGGAIFPDDSTGEASCFNCGCRLYDGYLAHTPSLEDRSLAEFDLLPYSEQVRILRAQRKKPGPGYYPGHKKVRMDDQKSIAPSVNY